MFLGDNSGCFEEKDRKEAYKRRLGNDCSKFGEKKNPCNLGSISDLNSVPLNPTPAAHCKHFNIFINYII